jgi:large subunit ribosomal protein L6
MNWFDKKLSKKYIINIPKNISVIYSENHKMIILIGPFGKRILKLKTKVFLNLFKNKIYISKFSFLKMSFNETKKLRIIQGTAISLIKQYILEISTIIYQKLNLIGVGYRVFLFNLLSFQVLRLKLGYSHEIFFKLNTKTQFFCLRTTILFIFGNIYQLINEISSKLRSYKIPEPYKGKGILYENEFIVLKKGKKI